MHGNEPNIISVSHRDVKWGQKVTVISPSNIYGCEIGDACFIGPFVEIQKGVKIGNHTRIQSHTFICELVQIGDNCFIGHGVMFINDKFRRGGPARGDKSLWMSTFIGNGVSIGSNCTILPVKICDDVVVGAGAVVTKDILESGIYAGNPAKKIKNIGL